MLLAMPPMGTSQQREAEQVEADLRFALERGVIDQPTFNQKLRVARAQVEGGGCLDELPTCAHGDARRLNLRGQWHTVSHEFPSKSAAQIAVASGQVVHGNNRGEWKYNSHATGGSKHHMHCNRHVGCRVRLQFHKLPCSRFVVQVTSNVMHSTEVNQYKRVNSPLTTDQERTCRYYALHGYTPKECKEALQFEVIRNAGGTVPKKLTGGIEGGHCLPRPSPQPLTHPPPLPQGSHSCCAGVPNALAYYQRLVQRENGRRASDEINCGMALARWEAEMALPKNVSELRDGQMYAVPMAPTDKPPRGAVAVVCLSQVLWILQLVGKRGWALHCDGKHGLHKGNWLLMTYGTHTVSFKHNAACKSHSAAITHTFNPLMYACTFGHEDIDSVLFGCRAIERVARMCAVGPTLSPAPTPPTLSPSSCHT